MARLEVATSDTTIVSAGKPERQAEFVRLVASNGETLMHSENVVHGERAKGDIIDAMIEVLREHGWRVEA